MKRIKGTICAAIGILVLTGILYAVFGNQGIYAAENVKPPVFSHKSGSYDDEFTLSLEAEEGSRIYYTTDGSIPLSKEEDDLKPTPTPIPPGAIIKDAEFDISKSNTAFIQNVWAEDAEDGVRLEFVEQYCSICFITPDGITDWTKYAAIEIEYTANQFQNGRDMGLQFCYIYDWADSSWDPDSSHHNRANEERTSAKELGKRTTVRFTLSGEIAEIGKLMIGVTNEDVNPGVRETVTIHSAKLIAKVPGLDIPTKKLPTNEYKNGIKITDRRGQENLLATEQNIKLMSQTSYVPEYYPTAEQVQKATVIRAMAVDEEGNRSNVVTRTFFVGNHIDETYKNASVMSVVTDRNHLLDPEIGICRNENYLFKGDEWERPAFVEYFEENGKTLFSTNMGIRIHGGYTRHYAQKSFNFYFREDIGIKNLNGCELIPGATTADGSQKMKYKKFMLRNGGNDTEYTKFQDTFIQGQVSDRAFTVQSTRPCVLFLNGEYWGLYNLTEKYSDNYLEEEFGVDKDNAVIIKDGELDEGLESDVSFYHELLDLAELDMTQEQNYEMFCEAADVQSCLDYYATEIFIGNNDWNEAKNYQIWRTREKENGNPYADTKWRWMLYDTESSMGLYGQDTGDYPIAGTMENDRLFRALIRNPKFRRQFITVLCDLMNVNFRAVPNGGKPSEMITKLNEYAALYRPLQEQYYERFGYGRNETNVKMAFDDQVTRIRNYLTSRRAAILRILKMELTAGGSASLTLKSNAAAEIKINTTSVKLHDGIWDGIYFKEIPVQVTAPEIERYRFIGWKAEGVTAKSLTGQSIYATLTGNEPVLEAVYQSADGSGGETPRPAEPTTPPTGKPIEKPTAKPTVPSSGKPTVPLPSKTTIKKILVSKVKIKSLKSKTGNSFVLTVKKGKGIEGYQIVYGTNKKLKKSAKKAVFKRNRFTVKRCRSQKRYYLKVRAYKRDGNGKKVYGKYSKIRSIRIKKAAD